MNGAPDARVGLIGVGALGLAVAERLLGAGRAMSGYRRGDLGAFAALGGERAASAAAVAAHADPLILLLPDDDALASVMAEIAPFLRQGALVLCLGTHRAEAKAAALRIAQAASALLLDGEVSGTPAMMRAGRASVMIAGNSDAYERAAPILKDFASATTYLGAFGDATKMKLITNFLVGAHTLAAAEAIALAERLGLSAQAVLDTIVPSAGGSTMLAVRGRMMADANYAGGGIEGFLRFFDLLDEALAQADARGGPLFALVDRLYRRAAAQGRGGQDIAAIYESLKADALRTGPAQTEKDQP